MSVTFYTTNHFWHHYRFLRPAFPMSALSLTGPPGLKDAQIVEEDHQHHDGAEIAQQEDEGSVNPEFQGSVVGNLILEHLLVEFPTDEDAGEESADGQHDIGREVVQQVEEVEPEQFPPA